MCYNLKTKVIQINKNSFMLRRKGICFLFSIIVHAVFLYFIFDYKFSVNIIPSQEKITDVIIASPEKIFFPISKKYPELIENFVGDVPEESLDIDMESSLKGRKPSGGLGEDAEDKVGVDIKKDQAAHETVRVNLKSEADFRTFIPGLSSRFHLVLPSESQKDLILSKKLNFSLVSKQSYNLLKKIDNANSPRDLKISRNLLSEVLDIKASGSSFSSSNRYRTGSSVLKEQTSFYGKGLDINSWVNKLLERIKESWIIPLSQEQKAEGTVKILAVIKKNGELQSTKIVSSSGYTSLNRAALDAIDWNSPFPSLPVDFPVESLEAYFVFYYND